MGSVNKAPYCSSKHGIIGLTKVVALEAATKVRHATAPERWWWWWWCREGAGGGDGGGVSMCMCMCVGGKGGGGGVGGLLKRLHP